MAQQLLGALELSETIDKAPLEQGASSFRRKIEQSARLLPSYGDQATQNSTPPKIEVSPSKTLKVVGAVQQLDKAQQFLKNLDPKSPHAIHASKKLFEALQTAMSNISEYRQLPSGTTQASSISIPLTNSPKRIRRGPSKLSSSISHAFIHTKLQENTAKMRGLQSSKNAIDSPEFKLLKAERKYLLAQLNVAGEPGKVKKSKRKKSKLAKNMPDSKVADESEALRYSRRLEGVLSYTAKPTLEDVQPEGPTRRIASLAHGLDRVLFNPTVHWFQDPHSKVYNFMHTLQHLPSVSEFAFDRVAGFVTSSHDTELSRLAREHHKRFTGSTSSLSGILSHIYYLISSHKQPDISTLTAAFQKIPKGFSGGTKIPTSIAFRKSKVTNDLYSMDSVGDKEEDGKNILTFLGTMLEKYLTFPEDAFKKLLKTYTPSPDETSHTKEPYRYAKSSKFIMRSQLDCCDKRLPGTGVFDIKTRACIAIRVDRLNWEENAGYQITQQTGLLQSFEREYFDLIRSAFLKFQFQVRIGNMDGVFVAYHNTAKLFGFQYIPLTEMDQRLFGDFAGGERVFAKCVGLLEVLVDEIVTCFPNQSVRCLVETLEGDTKMRIWVQPENEMGLVAEEIDKENKAGPMALLLVTASNFMDGQRLKEGQDIAFSSDKWSVHYTISHSAEDKEIIRKSYAEAMHRKNMAMYLPAGIPAHDFLKQWQMIDYGKSKETAFDGVQSNAKLENTLRTTSKIFLPAHQSIKNLRRLARRGWESSNSETGSLGNTKVVWGQPIEQTFETADGFGHIIFQGSGMKASNMHASEQNAANQSTSGQSANVTDRSSTSLDENSGRQIETVSPSTGVQTGSSSVSAEIPLPTHIEKEGTRSPQASNSI